MKYFGFNLKRIKLLRNPAEVPEHENYNLAPRRRKYSRLQTNLHMCQGKYFMHFHLPHQFCSDLLLVYRHNFYWYIDIPCTASTGI